MWSGALQTVCTRRGANVSLSWVAEPEPWASLASISLSTASTTKSTTASLNATSSSRCAGFGGSRTGCEGGLGCEDRLRGWGLRAALHSEVTHQSLHERRKVDIDLAVRRADHERHDLTSLIPPMELGMHCGECGRGQLQLNAQLREASVLALLCLPQHVSHRSRLIDEEDVRRLLNDLGADACARAGPRAGQRLDVFC